MKTTGWKDLVFVTTEVTPGTLLQPAAANAVRLTANPKFYQPKDFLSSEERVDSLSEVAQIQDRSKAGNFNFDCYVKPSGTAGTDLALGYSAILEGLFGRKTVTGGNNVTFNNLRINTDTRKTYSIFYRFGDGMVFQMSGCLFNTGDFKILARGKDALLKGSFGGDFMQQRRAGKTVTVAGSTTTAVNLTTGAGKFFDAGAYIQIPAITQGGNPWILITSIAGDVLTVATLSGAPGTGISVSGYYPAPSDAGFIVPGWRGVPTLSGTNWSIVEADIHFENFIDVLDDEKNGADFADSFVEGVEKRMITGQIKHYFDSTSVGGMDAYNDLLNQTQKNIVLVVGNQAGKIITFNMPQSELMVTPDIDTSSKVYMTRKFRGIATSAYDDESSVVLT